MFEEAKGGDQSNVLFDADSDVDKDCSDLANPQNQIQPQSNNSGSKKEKNKVVMPQDDFDGDLPLDPQDFMETNENMNENNKVEEAKAP